MTPALARRQQLVALAALAAMPAAFAQVLFREDFQTVVDPGTGETAVRCQGYGGPGTYPFPAGWLLRNVDNRTPSAAVAYVNDAWEVREDFGLDASNCVAFSTSWYTPVGAADDWMWTPPIGPLPSGTTRLTWRARAYDPQYPDGYQVRVMTAAAGPPTGDTGVLGNQVSNSTVVFATAAEQTTWANRSVDLSAYAGQQIYIGFRNDTDDRFLLVIDDIAVEAIADFDPGLLDLSDTPTKVYAKLPAPLAYAFDLQAQVRNFGSQALSDVVVEADLLANGQLVDSFTSAPLASLAPEETQAIAMGSAVYDQPGIWTLEATVAAAEGDQRPENSSLMLELMEVTQSELTRAQGASSGTLGIGAGTGGELGTFFDLPVPSKLLGARVEIVNGDVWPPSDPPGNGGDGSADFNGFSLELRLREWDPVAGRPGALMATATFEVPEDAEIGPLTLAFDLEGRVLPPGRYVLSLAEPTAPHPLTLTLQLMPQRYTPGASWVIWPASGGWNAIESYGANYQRALAITALVERPQTVPLAVPDAFLVPQVGSYAGNVALNDTPSDDGGNVWSLLSQPAAGLLEMDATGAFTYSPDPTSAGSTLGFEYVLCDIDDDCSTATVELQVQINLPVANDDAFELPPSGVLVADVSLNDTPSDDGGNVWSLLSPPAAGMLELDPAGAFTYTPDPASAGSTLVFVYQLCDIDKDCDSAAVQLQVLGLPIFHDSFESPP